MKLHSSAHTHRQRCWTGRWPSNALFVGLDHCRVYGRRGMRIRIRWASWANLHNTAVQQQYKICSKVTGQEDLPLVITDAPVLRCSTSHPAFLPSSPGSTKMGEEGRKAG